MSRKSKAAEFVDEGYNITVTGRNVQVTDAMKDYAIEKVSKIERFSTRIIDVVITMDIQKFEHRVDIILKVNQITIKSQAISPDMYASIDKAVNKINSQLYRYKTKLQEYQHRKLATVDMNVNVLRPYQEEILEVNNDIDDENKRSLEDQYRPHEIVCQETLPLKNLTTDEALMKMELSGDIFLIYRDEEDLKLKVIYRRNDKNYGIIEPEGC